MKNNISTLNTLWLILCIVCVPCIFFLPSLDYLNLPREFFWLGSASLLFLIQVFSNNPFSIGADKLTKIIFLFLFWAIISSCWAWQPQLSLLRWSVLAAAAFTFFTTRPLSTRQQRCILWVFSVQGLFLSVLGFLQYFEIEPFNQILQTDKPGLVMGHRNVAAEYLLITLGSTLALFQKGKTLKNTFLVFNIGVIGSIIGIIYCRGVIIGIAGAICIALLFFWSSIKNRWIKSSLSFLFIAIIITSFFVFYAGIPGLSSSFSKGKVNSMNMRIAHYSNTLMMAKESLPTGVGLGNFAINYSMYLNSWVPDKPYSDKLILRNAHSDPLECLAELGPVGLILLFILIYTLLIHKKSHSWQDKAIKLTIVAQALNACVNFPFQVIQTQMAMAILFGILHQAPINNKTSISFKPSLSLKFIFLTLFAFYFQFQFDRLQANMSARKGLDALSARKHTLALPHLRKAVEYAPHNVDLAMLLAYCLKEMNYMTESSSIAENVIGMFPGYLPALNLIGLNALEINDLNRSTRAFETSFRLQPHQESTKVKLSVSYARFAQELRKQNYFSQAYALEEKLYAIQPNLHEVLLRMIIDQIMLKDYTKAKELYLSIPSSYQNPRKYFVSAKIKLAESKTFEAIEELNKGLKNFPNETALRTFKETILINISKTDLVN